MNTLNEDLIYHVWQVKRLHTSPLFSTNGQKVEIIKPGSRNPDSGPDFLNAHIRINDILWIGHVEMHVLASDWKLHKHQMDDAYRNVILHVVYEMDKEVQFFETENIDIPTLEIKDLITKEELKRYKYLMHTQAWIPCESLISSTDLSKFHLSKSRLLIERVESKVKKIFTNPMTDRTNFETILMGQIFKYFGAVANSDAFEMLAHSFPLSILWKNADDPLFIEALLFGQAGFLEIENDDVKHSELRKYYTFIRKKYSLHPLPVTIWKKKGMRPSGMPIQRLAQLTAVLQMHPRIFSALSACESPEHIYQVFAIEPDVYWKKHRDFGQPAKIGLSKPSAEFVDRIFINAIIPVLFQHAAEFGEEDRKESLLMMLDDLKKEDNQVIAKWSDLGLDVKSAFDSQVLLQLKKEYCDRKRCLECAIGVEIMQNEIQMADSPS